MQLLDQVDFVRLCTIAGFATYEYFETPFMRMKRRFEVVRSRAA